jgi:hypothetical protein
MSRYNFIPKMFSKIILPSFLILIVGIIFYSISNMKSFEENKNKELFNKLGECLLWTGMSIMTICTIYIVHKRYIIKNKLISIQ